MNMKDYANLQEFVIGLNDFQLYNLFEILIREMNLRKNKTTAVESTVIQ